MRWSVVSVLAVAVLAYVAGGISRGAEAQEPETPVRCESVEYTFRRGSNWERAAEEQRSLMQALPTRMAKDGYHRMLWAEHFMVESIASEDTYVTFVCMSSS